MFESRARLIDHAPNGFDIGRSSMNLWADLLIGHCMWDYSMLVKCMCIIDRFVIVNILEKTISMVFYIIS